MDVRSADEGQSWLSAKGGGTKLGEALFDPRVTLFSDPAEPIARCGIPLCIGTNSKDFYWQLKPIRQTDSKQKRRPVAREL